MYWCYTAKAHNGSFVVVSPEPSKIYYPGEASLLIAKRFAGVPYHETSGKQHYLWRAKRDGTASKRFFKRLLRSHGGERRKIVTHKLRSYGVAHRERILGAISSKLTFVQSTAFGHDGSPPLDKVSLRSALSQLEILLGHGILFGRKTKFSAGLT